MDVRVVDVPPDRADELVALYDTWEWWADRDVEAVAAAVENSTVVVGLERTGSGSDDETLVASARVVSDGVYYARMYDVVVHEADRGQGLGERLVRETVEHPALDGVEAVSLGCEPDLVEFYEDCGFEPPPMELRQVSYGRRD
jgi:ribosomal protein S18 acetylase RimI-like enzyme